MRATQKEVGRILAALAAAPHEIERAVVGLDETELHAAPDKKTWALADILAHLRACADIWTFTIYGMLAEDTPSFPDLNERKWAQATDYAALPFDKAMRAFAVQREELFRVLNGLPFEKWERSAQINGRKHTVFTQARRMAKHEAAHIEQIRSGRAYFKKR
jgi:hypothetical protein